MGSKTDTKYQKDILSIGIQYDLRKNRQRERIGYCYLFACLYGSIDQRESGGIKSRPRSRAQYQINGNPSRLEGVARFHVTGIIIVSREICIPGQRQRYKFSE